MKTSTLVLSGLMTAAIVSHAAAKPIMNGTYYEERVSGKSCGVGSCTAPFTVVPAGRQVISKQIDCLAGGSKLHPLYAFFKVSYVDRLVYVSVDRTGDDGDNNYYHFSYSGPLLLAGNPLNATILASSADDISLSCTIVGEIK